MTRVDARCVRALGTALAATAALLAGCGEEGGRESVPREPEAAEASCEFVRQLGLEREASELRTEVLRDGEGGAAEPGDTLVVHYTGCLTDGRKFDSSRDRDAPFGFVLGAGRVIAGWERGLEGMRPGERRVLVIPPRLAYGEAGAGEAIPPNSTLAFDVELLEIR